ncbi:SAFB-like transcription modulator isoform X1 [Limulus polyphemus]|uniref:SAFB-like transcription modulator isoform X1 n=1 Tax=Limulus polyphemus TaxID=6850 RepID=A0ABM1BIC8_LIMPO|nr:SAFB-like transcription modulator isoform X1 [Limulus polyphemus]
MATHQDQDAGSTTKKKITDLRVVDLRAELEKRGLDKTGVKAALIERLTKCLQEEGLDPDSHLFEVSAEGTPGKKTPISKRAAKRSLNDSETQSNADGLDDDDEKEDSDDEKTNTEDLDMVGEALQSSVVDKCENDNRMKGKAKEMTKEGMSVTPTLEEENSKSQEEVDSIQQTNNKWDSTKDNSEEVAVEQASALSSPKPESAPVVAPLTVEDVLSMHSPDQKPSDSSLIVNIDDMQSDLDADLEGALSETGSDRYRDDKNNSNNLGNDKQSLESESKNDKDYEDKTLSTAIIESKKEIQPSDLDSSDQKKIKLTQKISVAAVDGDQQEKEAVDEKETAQEGGDGSVTKTTEEQQPSTTTAASKAKSTAPKNGKSVAKEETRERSKRMIAASRNLWVSGLASNTRAADLKSLFSKHGKVVGAKIVTNAKTPGSRCYGLITMANSEDASKCIQHLHRTELHGKMISVEKTKHEPFGTLKRTEGKPGTTGSKKVTPKGSDTAEASISVAPKVEKDEPQKEETTTKEEDAKNEEEMEENKEEEKPSEQGEEQVTADENKEENEEDTSKEKKSDDKEGSTRSHSRSRGIERSRHGFSRRARPFINRRRGRGRGRGSFSARNNFSQRRDFGRKPFVPRFGSRFNRSSSFYFQRFRRERESDRRQKDIERKQREESFRLERERERLRIERERLDRERAEILRLEREKQRMEREHLEREREELRRRQYFSRMDAPRRGFKRNLDQHNRDSDNYWEDRKRPAIATHFDRDEPLHGESSTRESRRVSGSNDREERRGSDKSGKYDRSASREDFRRHDDKEVGRSNTSREREATHRGPKEEWKSATYDKEGQARRGRFFERGKGWGRQRGSYRGGRGGSWNADRGSGSLSSGWGSESRKVGFSQNQWRGSENGQGSRWVGSMGSGNSHSSRSQQGTSGQGMSQQPHSSMYSSSGPMSHSGVGGFYGGTRYMGGSTSRY